MIIIDLSVNLSARLSKILRFKTLNKLINNNLLPTLVINCKADKNVPDILAKDIAKYPQSLIERRIGNKRYEAKPI